MHRRGIRVPVTESVLPMSSLRSTPTALMVRMERLTIAVCISSAAPMAGSTTETISALLWAARSRTVKEAVEDARRIKRVKRSLRYECFRADVASVEAQLRTIHQLRTLPREQLLHRSMHCAQSHQDPPRKPTEYVDDSLEKTAPYTTLYGEQSKLGSPSLKTIWVALHRISPPLHFYHLFHPCL